MIRYLLDTNTLSDFIRDPDGRAGVRMRTAGEDQIAISIIVAAELRFGAAKRNSAALDHRIESVLDSVQVVPFEAPADRFYGEIRSFLQRTGQSIGGNDVLIAAHALALDCTVVTANEREFDRVPNLRVENWLGDH